MFDVTIEEQNSQEDVDKISQAVCTVLTKVTDVADCEEVDQDIDEDDGK